MLFFAKNKLASLDKQITIALCGSDWYANNLNKTIDDGFDEMDTSEPYAALIGEFIATVWGEKGYRKIVEPAGLNQRDLIKIYLFMTMATMPDPIIKTGRHPMAHSLIASCIYQQEKRQLIPFMNQLRLSSVDHDRGSSAEHYVETSMKFAKLLQTDITAVLGPVYLLEAATRLTGGLK